MSTVDSIIDAILAAEGGFVNHPDDRGGPTKYGITASTLSWWRNAPVTPLEVEHLTEAEARAIYHDRYIVQPGFLSLPEPLRTVTVDWAVLSGPETAVRGIQRALGVPVDGKLGPVTISAARAVRARTAAVRVCAEQARQIGRIISNDHSQAVFAAGWMNRLADKLVAAEGDAA